MKKKETEEEKDRRLVEGYTRIPPDGEFDDLAEWGARRLVEDESWPDEDEDGVGN